MNKIILIVVLTYIYTIFAWAEDMHEPNVDQEKKFGYFVDAQITTLFPVLENKQTLDAIYNIGNKMVDVSERKGAKFTFKVLVSPLVNAISGPGNYIYIATGILDLVDTKDELAALLGHEISHSCLTHSLISYKRGQETIKVVQVIDILTRLASAAATTASEQYASVVTGQVAALSALAIYMGNSREQENEADRKAIIYLTKAGYNPYAMIEILKKIKEYDIKHDAEHNPEIFSTHPHIDERIKRTTKFADKIKNGEVINE